MADDMGAWAMNCAGNKDIITPNLDQLAVNGIRYDNFFCTSPVCSPARASIATGTMPSFHGVHDWIAKGNVDTSKYDTPESNYQFPTKDTGIDYLEGIDTYMEHLGRAGYKCSLSGKWHLGSNDEMKEGFNQWYTIATGGCWYYAAETYENGQFQLNKEYITDSITNKAIDYIKDFKSQEDPFYLSVHYTAPHSPWDPDNHPDEYLEMYRDCEFSATPDLPVHNDQVASAPVGDTKEARTENLTGYYASITAMDAGIGKIMEELEKSNQLDNTVIIFTSDNGMNMGHHGIWGKGNGTYPPNMFDSSIKVPFIISGVENDMKNTVSQKYATHCDVFPTILEIAGIPYTPHDKQPGVSLYSPNSQQEVIICDEYGIVRMIRTKEHKFIKNYKTSKEEFYDISKDIDETNDLIDNSEYQTIIKELREKLESWFTQYGSEQNSGIKCDVRGGGQFKLCHEDASFNTELKFYHKHREGDNIPSNK